MLRHWSTGVMARPGATLVEYAVVNVLVQKLSVSNSCFVIPGLGHGVMG